MTLGKRLREVREILKLKQKEIAKKIGVTPQSYSRYEKDERKPDSEFLTILCKVIKVNVNWLLTGQGDMFDQNGFFDGFSDEALKDPYFQEMIEHMKKNDVLRLKLQQDYLYDRNLDEIKRYEDSIKSKKIDTIIEKSNRREL